MAKQVETTYGDALLDLALEEGTLDALYEEAQALVVALQENEDLIRLLAHPQIEKEEKKKIVENIFDGRASSAIVGLLVMLVEKDHGNKLVNVLQYFIRQVKREKNIGVASVTSAVALNDSQKQAIEKRLVETTDFDTMEISYIVDASLIGGLVIRIDDRVLDSSIKTKIEKMSKTLAM
ncbi:MAG: ATP synthase F1 subunit delta [Wujia sp.]